MPNFPPLLDHRHSLLLRAALADETTAVAAYRAWRATEKLDDTDDTVYRIMPLLLATAERAGMQDSESPRMRGAIKHIWLSNMLRIRDLAEAKTALDEAGVDSLLIKGGALFARNPQFAALRAAGDYDLQVRRRDASRAIDVLTRASFEPLGMRPDLFRDADFDRDIHAVAMTKTQANRALDLHWRPLPGLYDTNFVEELFANAEAGELLGQKVLIPGLADHLFLAAVRAEPWDTKEVFLRAIEITHLLRSCRGLLDWPRFEAIVDRYGMGWIAAPLLSLVRDEVGAPMPEGLVARVWRAATPAKALQLSLRHVQPSRRRPWQKTVLVLFESLRSQQQRAFSWRTMLTDPGLLLRAFAASELQIPFLTRPALQRLWTRFANNDLAPDGGETSFAKGFSIPEPEGRWTDAEFAVIEIAVGAGERDTVKTELCIVPFLPPTSPAFEFDIYTGVGKPLRYRLTSSDPMPFRLCVDAPVAGRSNRKVVLALRMMDLRIPSAIGHSDDPRLLGLLVKSCRTVTTAKAECDAGQ